MSDAGSGEFVNRHDGRALLGIVVGTVVSVVVTVLLMVDIDGEATVVEGDHGVARPVVDFAVIRVPDPDRPRVRVRMSGPESPATGWHPPHRQRNR